MFNFKATVVYEGSFEAESVEEAKQFMEDDPMYSIENDSQQSVVVKWEVGHE